MTYSFGHYVIFEYGRHCPNSYRSGAGPCRALSFFDPSGQPGSHYSQCSGIRSDSEQRESISIGRTWPTYHSSVVIKHRNHVYLVHIVLILNYNINNKTRVEETFSDDELVIIAILLDEKENEKTVLLGNLRSTRLGKNVKLRVNSQLCTKN